MTARVCFICNDASKETRPYGKAGTPICFPCMQATPEREAEAKRQLEKQLAKIHGPAVLGPDGPITAFYFHLAAPRRRRS